MEHVEKITVGEMRSSGVNAVRIYCADHKCKTSDVLRLCYVLNRHIAERQLTCRHCQSRMILREYDCPAFEPGLFVSACFEFASGSKKGPSTGIYWGRPWECVTGSAVSNPER